MTEHGGTAHNEGGSAMTKPMCNKTRVEETASFIAAELKALLDRYNMDSHMSRRIREACPAYENGLTNSEKLLATLRALSMVQIEVGVDFGTLTTGHEDFAQAEGELHSIDTDEQLLKRLRLVSDDERGGAAQREE